MYAFGLFQAVQMAVHDMLVGLDNHFSFFFFKSSPIRRWAQFRTYCVCSHICLLLLLELFKKNINLIVHKLDS